MRQNILVAAIVSGGLCLAIGLVGGALLTKSNRENTKAILAALKTENKIKATKEKTKETKRITNELTQAKAEIDLLSNKPEPNINEPEQAKNNEQNKPETLLGTQKKTTEPKRPESIKQVRSPIFGVYLGESLEDLIARCQVEHLGDEGVNKIYKVDSNSTNVKYQEVWTFADRIYVISVFLADSNTSNYNAVIQGIKSKYEIIDDTPVDMSIFGEVHIFKTSIDNVDATIVVKLEKTFMGEDKLRIIYFHEDLKELADKADESDKASKIKNDL